MSEKSDKEQEKKAKGLSQKTSEIRKSFNLPQSETVIQDYACSLRGALGRLYVTQNYLCFWGNFNIKSEAFPFRKIKDLTLERGGVFNSVGLAMLDGSKVNIGGFVHLDEAFQLISYVWQNPPTYVSFAQQQQQLFESDSRKSARPGSSQVQEQIDQGPQVDVETSKRALALANEIYQTSSESLVQLAEQGETLDRIESNLNNIHYNLDQSDRLLRGIESLPAYIGNALKKKKRPPPPAPVKNDHSINIKKAPTPPMDIEILCKNKDDSFSQALLRLYDAEFSCIDPDTGKLLPRTQTWKYTEIDSVVMRARHQHMDISQSITDPASGIESGATQLNIKSAKLHFDRLLNS